MAEGGCETRLDLQNPADLEAIPPTGCFELDISLVDDSMELFITPNTLNETPVDEERGDFFDLLTSVSPSDPGVHDNTCDLDTSTPRVKHKNKARSLSNVIVNDSVGEAEAKELLDISNGVVNETIGDNTLLEFSENLSLSSNEEEPLSLASRVKNKETVRKMKGRLSVANPNFGHRDTPQVNPNGNQAEEQSSEKSSRFVRASEKEIDDLEFESKAKRTHMSTKWGIKTFTGRSNFG